MKKKEKKITPKDFAILNDKFYRDGVETMEDHIAVEAKKGKAVTDKLKHLIQFNKTKEKTTPSRAVVMKSLTPHNVMTTSLSTVEVAFTSPDYDNMNEKKLIAVRKTNIDNYHKQIKNNFIIGAKAMFLVCRDIAEASRNLATEDYNTLKDMLPISDATISKYLTIGKSDTCKALFLAGKMPDTWTTAYKMAMCKDKSLQQKLLKNVTVDSTAEDVGMLLDNGKGRKGATPSIWKTENKLESPKDFLRILVEGNSKVADIDPNTLLLIQKRVEQVVNDSLKEMKINDLPYYVSQKALDVKIQVIVDKGLIKNATMKVLNFFKKKMTGTVESNFAVDFMNKQKEVKGELSTLNA